MVRLLVKLVGQAEVLKIAAFKLVHSVFVTSFPNLKAVVPFRSQHRSPLQPFKN